MLHTKQAKLSPTPFFSDEQIQKQVKLLAEKISKDFFSTVHDTGFPLIMLGVLKGSFIFLGDLARKVTIPVEIEFASISSYGNQRISSGTPSIQMTLHADPKGRNVLIVEDVIDTGKSIKKLLDCLLPLAPKTVRICSLLNKPEINDIKVDYNCFSIRPDDYLVGYGLDDAQQYRNLPDIYQITIEE